MKARFRRDSRPHEGGPYKKGQVVDLAPASYQRWHRRQAIEPVGGEPAASKRKPKRAED